VTRPGGNLIGFSMFEFSIGGKWLDLLKEISPRLARVGVMFNPDASPQSSFFMRSIEAAALSLGELASVIPVRATADIEPAFERFARAPNGGMILRTDTFTRLRQKADRRTGRPVSPARHILGSRFSQDRRPDVLAPSFFGVNRPAARAMLIVARSLWWG